MDSWTGLVALEGLTEKHYSNILGDKLFHHAKKPRTKSGPQKDLKGDDYTALSKRLAASRTAVCCIITKHKDTHSVINKPERGRKCKVSQILKRKIVRDDVARKTVMRLFIVMGLESIKSTSKPDLSLPVTIWNRGMSFISLSFGLKHTSKLVQNFLEDTKIKVLEASSQSPDCNPLENL